MAARPRAMGIVCRPPASLQGAASGQPFSCRALAQVPAEAPDLLTIEEECRLRQRSLFAAGWGGWGRTRARSPLCRCPRPPWPRGRAPPAQPVGANISLLQGTSCSSQGVVNPLPMESEW